MSRHSPRDQAWFRLRREVLADSAGVCGICQHDGADTADHILPASTHPHLRYERANLRAAHGVNGCPVCGRRCNQERGTKPVTVPDASPCLGSRHGVGCKHSRPW